MPIDPREVAEIRGALQGLNCEIRELNSILRAMYKTLDHMDSCIDDGHIHCDCVGPLRVEVIETLQQPIDINKH
jgi:hypothetical protein